jgi:hypothetical protein
MDAIRKTIENLVTFSGFLKREPPEYDMLITTQQK